jgi:hypothetical protein
MTLSVSQTIQCRVQGDLQIKNLEKKKKWKEALVAYNEVLSKRLTFKKRALWAK